MCSNANALFVSVISTASDVLHAWRITPNKYAQASDSEHRRDWRLRERLLAKRRVSARVFWRNIELRRARSVVIRRMGNEGLLANLLHVLEVLHRVRSGARVHVSWILDGTEKGFRYGRIGDDVWTKLFAPLSARPTSDFLKANFTVDCNLWGSGKDHLAGRSLARHRRTYAATVAKWIFVSNERVRTEVHEMHTRCLQGKFCIGVHRRVPNAFVANCQRDGKVPSLEQFVRRIWAELHNSSSSNWAVFLATDDADVVPAFRHAFGERLVVRDKVQRTTWNNTEVHYQPWGALSLQDAEDALIDTLLLAKCDVLLHASSSVSKIASMFNPEQRLVRVSNSDTADAQAY